jgi:uncharacterized protein (DUF362 family)
MEKVSGMKQTMKVNPLNRREFLRAAASMGFMTVISTVLEACSRAGIIPSTAAPTEIKVQGFPSATATVSPTVTPLPSNTPEPTASPTSQPTETPAPQTVDVAFIKTTDRAEGVRQAIDLLGGNPIEGKTVFLKPNFNSSDPAPASTHPDILRSVILKLKEMGAASITLGDRSGVERTQSVMENVGVFEMAQELGFEVIDFTKMEAHNWALIEPPDSHWHNGFHFARPILEAEAVVNVCCLKTHQYGGHFTMSMKNAVGMVARSAPGNNSIRYMDELHGSTHQRKMIAEINTAYTPALIVVDGVEAFSDGGPMEGTLVAPEVVLAGTDRVAIDAVGVALLRQYPTTDAVARGPIFGQEQIARAVQLGLGVDSPKKINLLTSNPDSAAYAEQIMEILAR